MSRWNHVDLRQALTTDEAATLFTLARAYRRRPVTFDSVESDDHDRPEETDTYWFPEPMPDEDVIAVGDASLSSLQDAGFVDTALVMRRTYWGLTSKGRAFIHQQRPGFLAHDPNESITHRVGTALLPYYFANVRNLYGVGDVRRYASLEDFDPTVTFDGLGMTPVHEASPDVPALRVEVERDSNNYQGILDDFETLERVGYHDSPHYTGCALWVFPRRSTAYKIINILVDRGRITLPTGQITDNTPLTRAQRTVAECHTPGFDAFTTYSKLMPWDFEFPPDHLAPIGDDAELLEDLHTDTAHPYVDTDVYETAVADRSSRR